jgi:hypothetical protein
MNKISSKEFDDFVKRQKTLSAAEQPDWDKERDDWIAFLKSLYGQIQTFLEKYQGDGVEIEYKDIELNEEYIGVYVVKKMIIHIGRQQVTLTPIGTLLIGSKGRVDVTGSAGKATLLLVDKDAVDARSMIRVEISVGSHKLPQPEVESKKNIEWVWKIASPPPVMKFIDLNAESFFQMIMEVSNA